MQAGIFLDRDGVINEVLSHRVKFVNSPADFYLLPGVGKAVKLLNDANYKVFVVTNQGGIGLGYMNEDVLKAIHDKMKRELAKFGASVTDIAYCPHKPQANCICRKPASEMILALAKKHNIDITKSYMVGDRTPDIEAGRAAGVKTVLVGERKEQIKGDFQFRDLLTFSKWITIS